MNKDVRAVAIAFLVEMLIMEISFKISGGAGLAVFFLGTALLAMYAYYEWRREQAEARERARIRMYADKINQAYKKKFEDRSV